MYRFLPFFGSKSSENCDFFLKLQLESDLTHRKANFVFTLKNKGAADLSPTLGKIGHKCFFFNLVLLVAKPLVKAIEK